MFTTSMSCPADDSPRPAARRSSSDVAGLVAAVINGDERAWADLIARYSSLVASIARKHGLSRADASDVSQTVWLRLVEHLDATLNDPGLRQRLRRAGTVTARQLTWASVGQRLMALYSGLVDRTSERGATP